VHQGQDAASEVLTLTHDAGLEQVNSAAVSECVGRARRISTSVASAIGRPCVQAGRGLGAIADRCAWCRPCRAGARVGCALRSGELSYCFPFRTVLR